MVPFCRRSATVVAIAVSAAGLALTGGPTAHADTLGFTSPSGNIGCVIDDAQVRCDIAARDWPTPARPQDCRLDYGQGIAVPADGPAEFVCAGDTALSSGPPLGFGESVRLGRFRCESSASGISCSATTSGHGFSIARQGYRFF